MLGQSIRNFVPDNNRNTVPIASDAMRPQGKNAVPPPSEEMNTRPMRADARLKMGAVVQAAIEVFATSGVDAPVREIAEKAGVGLGTVPLFDSALGATPV